MKIGIIGTGYVGLPTGVGLAELGNTVVCTDKNKEKIDDLKAGKLTIYEEGLSELFEKNMANGRLGFTTNMRKAVEGADVVLIAVGTPPHPVTHEADLKYILLTHCHADHSGGVKELKDAKGGLILVSRDDADGLSNPVLMYNFPA